MRPLPKITLLSGSAILVSGALVVAQGQQAESQPTSRVLAAAAAPAPSRDGFAGVWVYNAEDSLNAANGRKEDTQAMKRAGASSAGGGAPTGRTGGSGRSGGSGGGTTTSTGMSGGNAGFGGFGGGGMASPFTPLIANERRDLVRDLLEVPTELTISLNENEVTFVDHLDRSLTYPTTGKKKKYQLSASVFEAKAYWDGAYLNKEIEGAEGFKMRETYFLSENGQRLFVVLRMGEVPATEKDKKDKEKEKDAPVVGVNRIYDRVQR